MSKAERLRESETLILKVLPPGYTNSGCSVWGKLCFDYKDNTQDTITINKQVCENIARMVERYQEILLQLKLLSTPDDEVAQFIISRAENLNKEESK